MVSEKKPHTSVVQKTLAVCGVHRSPGRSPARDPNKGIVIDNTETAPSAGPPTRSRDRLVVVSPYH